ncbi:bifunctional proline dehydrogenase/L-glutamate gamma-semialdehyde dehydrogenase PutA [Xanthobacter sp. V4C-4]|uniref:bifunctional proline dehydrogenase/L-glutamate gamma-semialdehyde dehydrogenase PutA n=1 Tax=Xanthobacter cornucopiae TaxID=3119924 RepID=UPI00372ABFBC
MICDPSPSAPDETPPAPFAGFAGVLPSRAPLRRAIADAGRRPEPDCLAPLLQAATLPDRLRAESAATARRLVETLRAKPHGALVAELVQEFSLSSREGMALLSLAEALPRIPDTATRDALIRDKIGPGDWASHIRGRAGRPLLLHAAVWGLAALGRLSAAQESRGVAAAVPALVARCGAPLTRRIVERAVGRMGAQFVMGETIAEALDRARDREAQGFLYSYDMLGEAALTAADAARYAADYEGAVHAIGKVAAGRGIHAGPGLSVKLSALHPRYGRAQAERVGRELLPRLTALALLAKSYGIGLTIDAEEQDRLDLLEALCADPALAGWHGLGFVVQAYGRRCAAVLDWLIDLARRSRRRIMVRLVKGAYWDGEIKRAQVEGLADFPVFTRKAHADVSYIAGARKLLAARDAVFPQFATHNAQTLATIHHLAGPEFSLGSYEFQCLHGMGESLYEEVVGRARLGRPCRIYAPVGGHGTLLAYLVRRLLENGANASFVHRLADPAVPVDELVADPVAQARRLPGPGLPHPAIAAPVDLFADRRNSAGLDLSSDDVLQALAQAFRDSAGRAWSAGPPEGVAAQATRVVRNPGDARDEVGTVSPCRADAVGVAAERAAAAAVDWARAPAARRVAPLLAVADEMQARMGELMGLVMREAGRSAANAMAEVREAIDFLRYYAGAAQTLEPERGGLGVVACISPWNFPLAIFTGQVAAALAAGNAVLAKPAEETSLIAAEVVRLLHGAGIPADVLQLIPGDGAVGAALVAAPQVAGVLFTGSTPVARHIQRQLAGRLSADGQPVPLIAETGGVNAMVVDSSALAEQVVADVIASAFDSAGQRCSALRVLCVQDEVADGILALLRGAMEQLSVGPIDRLSTDVGPVITAEARTAIEAHVAEMARRGHPVFQVPLPPQTVHGTFVAPTLIEIGAWADVGREVFGPVLHVLRYRRQDLGALLDAVNASGYGLTFGLHTRLDATVAAVTGRVRAGNIYVNRNIIGAVVGVQPFGGCGLSGTGPKAGGPLYLQRLVRGHPRLPAAADAVPDAGARAFAAWLEARGFAPLASRIRSWAAVPLGVQRELPGPAGESNRYALVPRGTVLVSAQTVSGLLMLIAAALVTGNRVVAETGPAPFAAALKGLPKAVAARVKPVADGTLAGPLDVALVEGEGATAAAVAMRLAARDGAIVPLHAVPCREGGAPAETDIPLVWLLREVSLSVNISAAGGNASLLAAV